MGGHSVDGAMQIETADLPEFGLAVNWAMCRNVWGANSYSTHNRCQ